MQFFNVRSLGTRQCMCVCVCVCVCYFTTACLQFTPLDTKRDHIRLLTSVNYAHIIVHHLITFTFYILLYILLQTVLRIQRCI